MARLTPVSWQDLIHGHRQFGFEGPFRGGKHLYMVQDSMRLTIPNPHKSTIGVDLLARLLKQADISREEWLRWKP
ncbi:MAG: type II toxin-antitoxin system HicA family toxin [Candidatus Omnitrophota bacterium]|jgi:predicted RNA binding protein YcfA (HicA-like mRNA interferase family)|nr:MAG: type II toxin-antitoxin system HicA family toxin [Candidatus Omnitrophota bacterium]